MGPVMNVHHVELFYWVVTFKGIAAAAAHMPRKLELQSMSKAMSALEESLGTVLFQRRPFVLFPDGAWLYECACPLMQNLNHPEQALPSRKARRLRVAGTELVFFEYMPAITHALRKIDPTFDLSLHDGTPAQMREWLTRGEVDLAVVASNDACPPHLGCLRIVTLSLMLLVPKAWKIRSPDHFWNQKTIAEPLIIPSGSPCVCESWQVGLARRGRAWPPSIDVGSLHRLKRYVAERQGAGVTLGLPCLAVGEDVHALVPDGFPGVDVNLLWRKPATPQMEIMIGVARQRTAELWPNGQAALNGGGDQPTSRRDKPRQGRSGGPSA
jgi:DNA-binding transcriptional LysR family regulator